MTLVEFLELTDKLPGDTEIKLLCGDWETKPVYVLAATSEGIIIDREAD